MGKERTHLFYKDDIEGRCAAAIYSYKRNAEHVAMYPVAGNKVDIWQTINNALYGNHDDQLQMFQDQHHPMDHKLVMINLAIPFNPVYISQVCVEVEDYFPNPDSAFKSAYQPNMILCNAGFGNNYDCNKSFCENMWVYLTPKSNIPPLVQLLGSPIMTHESSYLLLGMMANDTEANQFTVLHNEWFKHLNGDLLNALTSKRIKEGKVIYSFLASQGILSNYLPALNKKSTNDSKGWNNVLGTIEKALEEILQDIATADLTAGFDEQTGDDDNE
jgi:hypothetical protein